MAIRGYGYRGKGRKGIAGRQIKRPSKTGNPKMGKGKKVKSILPGGFNGTFGFQ